MEWYNKSKEEVLAEFGADEIHGLSEQEAAARLEKYGKNELEAQAKKAF
jgi:Ca2+-transporting ATPase